MRPPQTVLLLLLSIATFLIAGCSRSRSDDTTAARGTDAPVPSADGASEAGRAMQLTDAGRERSASPGSGVQGLDPLPAVDPREAAFAAHRLSAAPLYPYDFAIDSLRPGGLSPIEREAQIAARTVLEQLLGGATSPGELVRPGSPGLLVVLEEFAGEPPVGARIRTGRPKRVGDEYSVPFRVLGERERWTGELVVEMADGEWYTTDIQVSASSISTLELFVPGGDLSGINW